MKVLAEGMKLTNVIFHGSVPLHQMPIFYQKSLAMIVTLDDLPFCHMTLPGKVQSYMASGKPIISCASGATNRLIIEANCGLTSESCDFVGLAKNIKALAYHPEQCVLYSKNASQYSNEHFSKKVFIDRLENECFSLKR